MGWQCRFSPICYFCGSGSVGGSGLGTPTSIPLEPTGGLEEPESGASLSGPNVPQHDSAPNRTNVSGNVNFNIMMQSLTIAAKNCNSNLIFHEVLDGIDF